MHSNSLKITQENLILIKSLNIIISVKKKLRSIQQIQLSIKFCILNDSGGYNVLKSLIY